jgi:UDP-4-amino-4-deoxy-L-arabinose-oxoglutarate aminotransferase
MKVEFFKHNIGPEEIREVTEVLNSVFLTTGSVVGEFETKFSNYLGSGHTVGVTSGTAALHLSLLACGVGPGDEVITTPMSFIATANSILHAGAEPVFVDVEPDTGNIDASLIERAITDKTKAIMPVHLYGQMVDMKGIRDIADRQGLAIIEDAAHCIEGERDGIRPAQLSQAACFSFYATKNITSGEGGAVSTNDESLSEKLRRLRLHGIDKTASERYTKKYQHYDMTLLGWKYNMDNIQAGLLLNQLDLIVNRLEQREALCRMYEEAFFGVEGVDFPKVLPQSRSARHMFTIWVDPDRRDEIMWSIQEQGIGVAINFRPIHLMEYYRERYDFKPGMFPNAEKIGARTITLPLYPRLSQPEIEFVMEGVKRAIAPGHA